MWFIRLIPSDAVNQLAEFWARCDAQLAGRDYICGDYSVADISVFMTAVFASTLGSELAGEHLTNWFERMMARSVVKAEVDAVLGAVAAL
jgi:glutathione S-transferase